MARHLASQEDFVASFKSFHKLMSDSPVLKDEENICRLFDMWLANFKDERVIEDQLAKEKWQQDGDDY